MSSYAPSPFSDRHPSPEQLEAALLTARDLHRGFDGSKGMAALLLAAIVSAMLVVADQLLETWVDGHLMAAWVALWAIGFVALALLAGTVRRFSARVFVALYAALELFLGVTGTQAGVAHFAHLGGLLGGRASLVHRTAGRASHDRLAVGAGA